MKKTIARFLIVLFIVAACQRTVQVVQPVSTDQETLHLATCTDTAAPTSAPAPTTFAPTEPPTPSLDE